MKPHSIVTAGLIMTAVLLSVTSAKAASVDVGINIAVPGVYVQPQPVYVQPEPVYVQPGVVYVDGERKNHGRHERKECHERDHERRGGHGEHHGDQHGNHDD